MSGLLLPAFWCAHISTIYSCYLRKIWGLFRARPYLLSTLLSGWPRYQATWKTNSEHCRKLLNKEKNLSSVDNAVFSPPIFSSPCPALNPNPLLSKQHWDPDSDTRKHFQAFRRHTSHPQAGWENRCQQSTTHSAGKEPDRISNEQQAATNPSPPQDVLEICSTMSSSLLSVAHKQEVVYNHKRLCEVLFISGEWLFHCWATKMSPPPQGRPVSSCAPCPAAKHFSWGPWSTPFPLQVALFSHEVSANGIILIALETIWEPKERFPCSEWRELYFPLPPDQSCCTGLKGAVLPELFAESDIN